VWAVSTPIFRHELISETAVGVKKRWDFARTPKGFQLNGLVLAPSYVAARSGDLKVLQEKHASTSGACPAGNYTFHTTRPGQKKVVEQGCLGSARFGQLRNVFEQLAKP